MTAMPTNSAMHDQSCQDEVRHQVPPTQPPTEWIFKIEIKVHSTVSNVGPVQVRGSRTPSIFRYVLLCYNRLHLTEFSRIPTENFFGAFESSKLLVDDSIVYPYQGANIEREGEGERDVVHRTTG